MTLACQFQHLLSKPVTILPDPVTTQPPARAGAVGAGFPLPAAICNKHHIEMRTRMKRGRPDQAPYAVLECRLCENERKGFPVCDPADPKYQAR